jgi:uncharacterized membrane protein
MNHRLLVPTAIALLSVLAACGDSGSTTGSVDCSTVKGYSELTSAFSKCTNCHDSALTNPTDRQAAPADLNYDTYDAAKAQAADIADQINQGLMPPSDQPQLTATEKTDLLTWAACDTPQ